MAGFVLPRVVVVHGYPVPVFEAPVLIAVAVPLALVAVVVFVLITLVPAACPRGLVRDGGSNRQRRGNGAGQCKMHKGKAFRHDLSLLFLG
jgi:hypothetical protein